MCFGQINAPSHFKPVLLIQPVLLLSDFLLAKCFVNRLGSLMSRVTGWLFYSPMAEPRYYIRSIHSFAVEKLPHALVCKFDSKEGCRVGRYRTAKRRSDTREESLDAATPDVDVPDCSRDGRIALSTL